MKSITDGINEIKDTHFGLTGCVIGQSPHFEHIAVLKELCGNPPATNGAVLADALLARIEQNWRAGRDKHETAPSRKNWRLRKRVKLSRRKWSDEVTFERDVVRVGGANWSNQVPTSSGFLGSDFDKKRNIDLVERKGPGEFELIELKIGSNTPLFAALEILEYGTLYVFSRVHANALGYKPGFSDLLEARRIRLRVLAPRTYYESKTGDGQLDWLGRTLQSATQYFSQRIGSVFQMDFGFDVFSDSFPWKPEDQRSDDEVRKMMKERHPLFGGLD